MVSHPGSIAAILDLCKLQEFPKVAALATKLKNIYRPIWLLSHQKTIHFSQKVGPRSGNWTIYVLFIMYSTQYFFITELYVIQLLVAIKSYILFSTVQETSYVREEDKNATEQSDTIWPSTFIITTAYLHSLLTPARKPRHLRSSSSYFHYNSRVKTNIESRYSSVAGPPLERRGRSCELSR